MRMVENLLPEGGRNQWAEQTGGNVPKELGPADYSGNYTERGGELHSGDVRTGKLRSGQFEKIQRVSRGDGGQNGDRES